MVRKSELQDATLDEVDFENALWSIPKERGTTLACDGVDTADLKSGLLIMRRKVTMG